MSQDAIVVTGATGNIGKRLAESLLAKGKKVRAVARTEKNLKALKDKGADIFPASVEDGAAMGKALQGAQAVFMMVPPNFAAPDFRAYQNRVIEAVAGAIRQNGVKHVVFLSSVGAHLSEKNGPIQGLNDAEKRLNGLEGVNVVNLRPGFFMENLYFGIDVIK